MITKVGGDFLKKSEVKENIELILIVILIIGGIVAFIYFNNFRKESCINKGGKVMEDAFGIYEKCIYGSDKE